MEGINLIHGDSLQALKGYADNHFDIAIVDPPYGINVNVSIGRRKGDKKSDYHKFHGKDTDAPSKEYFLELDRISKNQIIWGANYFIDRLPSPNNKNWIVWDKLFSNNVSFSSAELAWCSLNETIKIYKQSPNSPSRIHPTQKPVKLYNWILEHYTKQNDLILDTHLGSGSIAIACHYMKRKLIGYEIDKEYYDAACKRFKEQTMQQVLW